MNERANGWKEAQEQWRRRRFVVASSPSWLHHSSNSSNSSRLLQTPQQTSLCDNQESSRSNWRMPERASIESGGRGVPSAAERSCLAPASRLHGPTSHAPRCAALIASATPRNKRRRRMRRRIHQPYDVWCWLTATRQDVFVATPPKCGTTWMQQICYQLEIGRASCRERV